MKFGIFFEMSVPRPFTAEAEAAVFRNALEQARLVDELGFDWVWAVEHHFLEEYSHCSAPEVVLAAIAGQTTRVRIGHGAVVCVPEINHPVRVAERAATLDIVSGGRLELGTARSSTWTELGGFGVDPDTTKASWDEFVRVLPRMWTEEHVALAGRGFTLPERAVLPKPLQRPHPPMWVTVTSPGTEVDAADRGLGCLGVASVGYAEQERRTTEYFRRIESCDPVGAVVTKEVTTLNFLYCHEDRATAARRGMTMMGLFGLSNAHLLWTREAYPTKAYRSLANIDPGGRASGRPSDPHGVPDSVCIGDPDRITEVVRRWESLGLTGINFLLNAGEVLSQPEVLASLRLFATEVMPQFPGAAVRGA